MNRKIKDALTLGIAAAFVLMFALWGICKSDDAVSESERRPLKQFPTLNAEEVLSGRFQLNFESYTLDQFPLRDELRTLKALSVRDLFGEKDNNGIYVADGYAAKLDDTIHEDSLDHAVDRFRYVYETYLKNTGANVYLSVIPDKNYFLAAENGYPAMDYEKFFALMRQKVDFADYIDLFGSLSLDNYYRTDSHWRQETLLPAAHKFGKNIRENIGETAAAEIKLKAAERIAAELLALLPVGAELVIHLPLLLVFENFVRLVYFLELFLGILIAGVVVRVVLHGKLAVCLFDLGIACALGYPQHFVIITLFLCHIHSPLQPLPSRSVSAETLSGADAPAPPRGELRPRRETCPHRQKLAHRESWHCEAMTERVYIL